MEFVLERICLPARDFTVISLGLTYYVSNIYLFKWPDKFFYK